LLSFEGGVRPTGGSAGTGARLVFLEERASGHEEALAGNSLLETD
jgi:hypothetical protein